jgi:hypothetical protein
MTQAFPLQGNDEYEGQDGMTLRDYFAAQALQALIVREGQESFVVEEITITAYQYADSMLEVR